MNDERWLADDLVDPDVYAKGVDEGWTDIELYRLIVRQLQRSFHSGTESDRQTLLANRPHLTNTKWDAAMAAVIEHAALTHGYDAPAWGGRTRAVPPGTREADRVRDRHRHRPRLAARRVPPERGQHRQPGSGWEDRGWSAVDRWLNSENVVGLLDDLDRELDRAGGRAEDQPQARARTDLGEPGRNLLRPQQAGSGRNHAIQHSGKAPTVKGASAEHMLAMKIRSHRDIDLNDAEVLIDRLKLTSTREIQRIAEDAYEGHGADNRKMIQQGLNRIVETKPELTANHFAGEPQ